MSCSAEGLAKFDLWFALFIPYVLATSCVVIAAGSQFHLQPLTEAEIKSDEKLRDGYHQLVDARISKEVGPEAFAKLNDIDKGLVRASLSDGDRNMAAMLVKRDAFHLAASLENLTGKLFSHWIFGLGVLGMAISTIIILMTINGHAVCEIMGVQHKGRPFIGGALIAGLGILGPLIYQGNSKLWLAVPTSVFGYTLIPVAYLSFFLLMNSKKVLGRERPSGFGRAIWNGAMLIALAVMGTSAIYVAWGKKFGDFPFGKYALIAFGALLVCGHFQRQISRLTKKISVMDNKFRRQAGGGGRQGGSGKQGGRRRGGGNRGHRGKGGQRHGRPEGSGNQEKGGRDEGNSGSDAGTSSDE